ncbi:MAG: tetratricopeptide repeat protein [Tenuifilaceae bacterium]|nr:tetratricopeptide repeat protein [Tenuifilaceae bacterium]
MTSKKRFHAILVSSILVLMCVVVSAKNLIPDSINLLLSTSSKEKQLELLLSTTEKIINKYPEQAIVYAERALTLSTEQNDSISLALSHFLLAKALYVTGQYSVTLENLDLAHDFFISTTDSIRLTESYQLYSNVYVSIGEFSSAVENFQKALGWAIRIGDKRQIADLTRELGNIYSYFDEKAIALDFYQKSLVRSQEFDYAEGVAKAYNNIGRTYVEMGKFDAALVYLQKSLTAKIKEDDRVSYSHTLLNIASVYLSKQEYQKAILYLQDAYQNYASVSNADGMSNSQYYLGVAYKNLGRYNQAIALQNQAWEIASAHNLQRHRVNISRELADIYEKIGDYPKAHNFLTTYIELRDSVFSDEKSRLLMELETRYQLGDKQRQIELFSKQKALESSEKTQIRIWFAFLITLVLLLIALLYLLHNQFRYKNKTNKTLLLEISQRKEFEAQLNVYQEQLENLVEERTRELKEAKNRAEEADKLKSAFLANMSHEIRTPLNAIVGFSYLLIDKDTNDESRTEYMKIIKSNGEVLINLINDILDISIIEAGQLKTKIKPFGLNALFDELKFFFTKENLSKSAVELTTDFDAHYNSDLLITTDQVRLRQILANLIGNAVKFTHKGKISVGYRVSGLDKIIFFVKDTGEGIDPENHELIFERFSKFSVGSGQTIYSGTGLGLAICREMVGVLGGEIWVDSVLGKGSTFYFTLPFKNEDNATTKVNKQLKSDIELLKGRTILIAEPVEGNYKFLEGFLASLQMNTIWAKDGVSVINEFRNKSTVDIVLMNLLMPVLDGINTLKNIRKLQIDVPVIMTTTFRCENEKKNCFEAGCNAYIERPICNKDLTSRIIELLKESINQVSPQ